MKIENQIKIISVILIVSIIWRILPSAVFFSWPERESYLYNLYILSAFFYVTLLIIMEPILEIQKNKNPIDKTNENNSKDINSSFFLYLFIVIPISIFIGLIVVYPSLFVPQGTPYRVPDLSIFFKCYYAVVILITISYFVNYTKKYVLNFATTFAKTLNLIYGTIFVLIVLAVIYNLINSIIEYYRTNVELTNIYITALLIPGILLISKKTRRYFIFGYIIALASTYYFHVYKYSHDYEVTFEKQGITCDRIDNPTLGCSFESVTVNKGDEIETLDGKKETSTETVNTFCSKKGRPFTYYFQLNNTIYKYIYKKDTNESK